MRRARPLWVAGLVVVVTGCFDPTGVDTSETETGSSGGGTATTAGTSADGVDDEGATSAGPGSPDTGVDGTTGPGPSDESGGSSTGDDAGPPLLCGDGIVAPGELCLGDPITIAGGGAAGTLYAGHFDDDADLDLVISQTTTATLFLGNGGGDFVPQRSFTTVGSSIGSGYMVVGNVDAGDTLDLVASGGTSTIASVLGGGDGTFSDPIPSTYPSANALGLLPGDFDGDGTLDVLVARSSVGELHLGVGAGDGTFTFTAQYPLGDTGPMVAGDFDGDGNLDALVGQDSGTAVEWIRGMGGGALMPQAVDIGVAIGSGRPSAGDLGGDEASDAAFALPDTDEVVVVWGAVGAGPGTAVVLETVGEPRATAMADMDADGELDLVSCGGGVFASISVWRGDGAGGLADVEETTATPCANLALGDYDGDGAMDVAYHHGQSGGLRIVLADP